VDHRVEGSPLAAEALETVLAQHASNLSAIGRERALDEVAVLAREMDVVEHRQHRLEDVGDARSLHQRTGRGRRALVVDVFGLEALQVVEALGGEDRAGSGCGTARHRHREAVPWQPPQVPAASGAPPAAAAAAAAVAEARVDPRC
jgi:hypothetical protein